MLTALRYLAVSLLAACASSAPRTEDPTPVATSASGAGWQMPDGGVPMAAGPDSPEEIWQLSVQVYGERLPEVKPALEPKPAVALTKQEQEAERRSAALKAHLRQCYLAALKEDPELQGWVHLRLDTTKVPPDIVVEQSMSPAVDACVVGVFRRFQSHSVESVPTIQLRFGKPD